MTSGPSPGAPATPPDSTGPSARERLNLIEEITRAAVASDYDEAGAVPRGSRQPVLIAAAALGLAGFVLALGISVRILNDPVVSEQRVALMDRIAAADALNEVLIDDAADLRVALAGAREENLRVTLAGRVLASQIEGLELATGYAPVEGPGALVTLTDAPVEEGGESADAERVLDTDIQRTVNGLWAAGAEAIAVNGQRLTAQSAIRSAAGAILVNYRPLKPPYLVEAIGPRDLAERFARTPDAEALREVSEQFGIGLEASRADAMSLRSSSSPLPTDAEVLAPGELES